MALQLLEFLFELLVVLCTDGSLTFVLAIGSLEPEDLLLFIFQLLLYACKLSLSIGRTGRPTLGFGGILESRQSLAREVINLSLKLANQVVFFCDL